MKALRELSIGLLTALASTVIVIGALAFSISEGEKKRPVSTPPFININPSGDPSPVYHYLAALTPYCHLIPYRHPKHLHHT